MRMAENDRSSSGTGAHKEQTMKTSLDDRFTASKETKGGTLWRKLGLDAGTILMMAKGALPPTIALAFLQAESVAAVYSQVGYLVAIMSLLSFCIMPRAMYLQTMVLNVIGICVAVSISLLGIWCAIQARSHTEDHPAPDLYNSSASAVCAVWLFFSTWIANIFHAKVPALQFTIILYTILTCVALTYGPIFTDISEGYSIATELLSSFLTSIAIATGVSLIIIPVTSRDVVFKDQAAVIETLRKTLKTQLVYMKSLGKFEVEQSTFPSSSAVRTEETAMESEQRGKERLSSAKKVRSAATALNETFGTLHGDMVYGKREFAFGKLTATDIDEIYRLFQAILIPCLGVSTILEQVFEKTKWKDGERISDDKSDTEKRAWYDALEIFNEPFEMILQTMDEGLEHIGLTLELIPKPKKGSSRASAQRSGPEGGDIEASGDSKLPGGPDFAQYLAEKMNRFHAERGTTIENWLGPRKRRGIDLNVDEDLRAAQNINDLETVLKASEPDQDRQKLYLILYMYHLVYHCGMSIVAFSRFADSKVADGTMAKKKLIVPSLNITKSWLSDTLSGKKVPAESQSATGLNQNAAATLVRDFDRQKKDPEHLPPANAWERFGNSLRAIPRFLGSPASALGLRAACATMTIGIVAFLHESQGFFLKERIVWAMIIIAVSMGLTSGESVFGFYTRTLGTAIATVISIINWYMVNGHTAGVIVFMFVFIALEFYFLLKFERYAAASLICTITHVLIIGYQLQVKQLGVKAAESHGQPYYPVYLLGPYRLATVAGGSFVAFIWTILPYPITNRSEVRKNLGTSIYVLAELYSCAHSALEARIGGIANSDPNKSEVTSKSLNRTGHKLFMKEASLLRNLKEHSTYTRWEINIGGKFPKATYDRIIQGTEKIANLISLLAYTGESLSQDKINTGGWLRDVATILSTIKPTSHSITSILSLLSASLTSGTSLPPYISIPKPHELALQMNAIDSHILDGHHVEEDGYSALAVIGIVGSLISDELEELVAHVKELVGEVDFSFKED